MFSPRVFFFLLLLLPLLLSSETRAASPELRLGPASNASLAGHLDILEDKTGRLTISEASSPATAPLYHPDHRPIPNFGITSSVYWARFTLAKEAATAANWLLELDYPHMDFMELYLPQRDGSFSALPAGDMRPASERHFHHRNPVFPLTLAEQGQTFYLRIDARGRTLLPLTLWTPETFTRMDHRRGILAGAYLGAMLVMVAYNFFIFLSLRDRNYLYYLFDISSQGLYGLYSAGFLLEFVSGEHPAINQYAFGLAAPALFFGVLFARSFLDTARQTPGLDRLLRGSQGLALLALPALFLLPLNGWRQAMVLITLGASVLGIVAGLLCLLRGYRPARYFVGARIFRFTGILCLTLGMNNLLPMNLLTFFGLQLGGLLEVVLLSFAVADRITLLRHEKEAAQADAVRKSHLATLGELAAGVAHEINTPVNTIINSAELLLDDHDRTELEHDVGVIQREGRRIATIVKSLLFFARRPTKERIPFPVATLLQGTLDMIGARLAKDKITLTLELPSTLPPVLVHPQQIEQVFLNILTNASQALAERHGDAPDRKTFAIVATPIAAGKQSFVRIAFTDNGIGIPAFLLDTVKDSFVTTKKSGTGLGLSISQQIINDHGGAMAIASQEGLATTVSIDLPVAAGELAAGATGA